MSKKNLSEETLLEEYMADTRDDVGVINFLNSPECTKEMVNYHDDDGWSSLILAVRLNRYEVAKKMIEKGADVNYADWDHSYNALMHCMHNGSGRDEEAHIKTIKLLIEAGTNLNYEDRFSAFTMAASMNNTEVMKLLLTNAKINLDFKDEDDKSGMDYLKESNNVEILQLIEKLKLKEKLNDEMVSNESSILKVKI